MEEQSFITALANMEKRTMNKASIRAVACEHFDVPVGVQRYRTVYEKMLSKAE